MKTLAKVFFVCVACLSANLLIGCSEDPAVDNTPKRVIPQGGSSYTYTRTERTNTDPYPTVSGTDTVHTVTSAANFTSYEGKDTVITFVDINTMNSSATPDTMKIAYEANGDISIYRGDGIEGLPDVIPITIPKWWTLPFKSKANITIINESPNVEFSIPPFTVKIESVIGIATAYSNSENVVVAGQTFACDKSDVTFTISAKVNNALSVPIIFRTSYLFNESLGYFVSFDTKNNFPDILISSLGVDPDNNIQVLTSFDVKK